jgi:hypothetical protein
MKIFPRCLRRDEEFTPEKSVAFTASGYLVPCCWCDNRQLFEDFASITQEKFHISNISSPEEVLESEEWITLMNTIQNDPSNAPYVCKRKCSSESIYKQVIISTRQEEFDD